MDEESFVVTIGAAVGAIGGAIYGLQSAGIGGAIVGIPLGALVGMFAAIALMGLLALAFWAVVVAVVVGIPIAVIYSLWNVGKPALPH
jgi:hypothetical protein